MKQRQRTAFPPNYIHSIDSSHMMLTAIACHEAGACRAVHAAPARAGRAERGRRVNALPVIGPSLQSCCSGPADPLRKAVWGRRAAQSARPKAAPARLALRPSVCSPAPTPPSLLPTHAQPRSKARPARPPPRPARPPAPPARRCAGLAFAGVHDSFWTHAGDVDAMSAILRDQFIALYKQVRYVIITNRIAKTWMPCPQSCTASSSSCTSRCVTSSLSYTLLRGD